MRREIALVLSLALLSACGTLETTQEVTKAEAAAAGGKADNGVDYCAEYGWYDDDECDTFCPLPDPDCDEPEPTGECLFGESSADFESVDALTLGSETSVASIGLDALTAVRETQIVAGMTVHQRENVYTLQGALDVTDDSDIWIQDVTTDQGDALLLYTFWQGDNPMGFIYADGEEIAAYIGDGDMWDCMPKDDDNYCLFGETSYELLHENDNVTKGAETTVDQAAFDALGLVRRQQISIGFARHEGERVALGDIIPSTDDYEIYMTELTAPNGMQYVVYRFYQGDNPFGFIFADGEVLLGDIQDGYVEACTLR